MSHDPIVLRLEREVVTAVEPSRRVCEVAAMFGLGVDERKTIAVVPPIELTLRRGAVVFITGASGGGKTTLLRLIDAALRGRRDAEVIDFNTIADTASDDTPLIDAIGGTLEQATRWLAMAGLNDAFVMLRRPSELSDGQRYRWRLARALAQAAGGASRRVQVVLADEFGATLDRVTAKVIARNVRKWTRRSDACLVCASTHDDLLEALEPDTLIVQHPGAEIEPMMRGPRHLAGDHDEHTTRSV